MKPQVVVGVLAVLVAVAEAGNILDEIRARPELSQILALIEDVRLMPAQMTTQGYTAFMPTNEAMDAYTGPKDKNLVRYHLANIPYLIQDLPDEINTELAGNPRLYVSRKDSNMPSISGWEDKIYYINNAKVLKANLEAESDEGVKQVLHIVDQVIVPTIPSGDNSAGLQNPNAKKLLERPRVYGLVDQTSIADFAKRVEDLNLLDTFDISGKNTFFIPVDTALNKTTQSIIDKHVIHGHIVPEQVLFTRTVETSSNQYESLAFTDNLKVFISMENVTLDHDEELTYYVKSLTLNSSGKHNKGTVMGRIVKANIPVKNGVVHLIDRPLMVVASSISSYLQEGEGQLTKFYDMLAQFYPDLLHTLIDDSKNLTVFAPSNEAFNRVNQQRLEQVSLNRERIERLLELHVIPRRLTTDEIVERSLREVFQEESMSARRKLYFASSNIEGSVLPSVTLEGAGVNATITTANIAAHNGVIHIIDRILGIPSQTVLEKLASDPMLSDSFSLSEQNGWNKRLSDRNEKFTLFVPSNKAWDVISRSMPSSHKKLFMGEFAYHVRYILERHLVVGIAYSLDQLTALTTNATMNQHGYRTDRLDMMRGKIYFEARVGQSFGDNTTLLDTENPQASEYYVEWNGVRARVIRPDVECVNGVVHVIDNVLMVKRDVTVAASAGGLGAALPLVLALALALYAM